MNWSTTKSLGLAGLAAAAAMVGCDAPAPTAPDGQAAPAAVDGGDVTEAADGPLAPMLAAIDSTVAPCDDFYAYACGGWIAQAEIPGDRPFAARISTIVDQTEVTLRQILEAEATDAGHTKLTDFYAACMDEAAIDAAGVTPLQPTLAEIDGVKNHRDAFVMAAKLRTLGISSLFDAGVWPDDREPGRQLFQVDQGGLGLPNREFYLRDDDGSKALRTAYEAHIAAVLVQLGAEPDAAAASATKIVALEKALAEISIPLEQQRDADASYNKKTLRELDGLTKGLKWGPALKAMGVDHVETVNVRTPQFFEKLGGVLKKQDAPVLRDYLRFHVASELGSVLGSELEDEVFAFSSKVTGQTEPPPRWKRCVTMTGQVMPELLGAKYAEIAFAGGSKDVAMQMIVEVERAFERNLDELDWMDDPTRAQARDKAAKIINKIGYPAQPLDYATVEVKRDDLFASYLSAARFAAERESTRAGRPVDPNEWHMPAFMLNAYANPTGMEMVFPAGILQPPIFSIEQPMAVNFGSAGAIMGHELTHHFDDQGRKYDASGNLKDWWAPSVAEKFDTRATCVADAYGAYEVQPGLNVNGRQTLGENIADIGGLEAAFAAFQSWREAHPEAAQTTSSLTPEQQFFLAYAQTYCGKEQPAFEKMRTLSDVHSPRRFRANGGVSHNADFWEAFGCEAGTPMHPKTACEVW